MIQFQSEGLKKGEPVQHREARRIVEFYLETARGRAISSWNFILFNPKFVREHKLENRFKGHSYDIITQDEVIEIDGMNTKHSKKSQQINDGIAESYIKEYHPEYKFYRILQEEITNDKGQIQPDCAAYLKEHLF